MKKAAKTPSREEMEAICARTFLRGVLCGAVDGLSAKDARLFVYKYLHGATVRVELRAKAKNPRTQLIRWQLFGPAKPHPEQRPRRP